MIGVIGVGYVGTVQVAILLKLGYEVLAFDAKPAKLEMLHYGRVPVGERGCEEIIYDGMRRGALHVAESEAQVFVVCETVFVCVGTPQGDGGVADLSAVHGVLETARTALPADVSPRWIVVRSTVPPGTCRTLAQGLPSAVQLVHYPEFMREGSAMEDAEHPVLAVVGTADGQGPVPPLVELNAAWGVRLTTVTYETSELTKYACNFFHALKVAYANETAAVAEAVGADGAEVLRLIRSDTRLNISTAYLKPGPPFGGPCLPKDVLALAQLAKGADVGHSLMTGTLAANQEQYDRVIRKLRALAPSRLAVIGMGFKTGSEDLRTSPAVRVVREFAQLPMTVFDPAVCGPVLRTAVPRATVVTRVSDLEGDVLLVFAASPAVRRAAFATRWQAVLDLEAR